MNRAEFHDFFKNSGPIILPVIHVINKTQIAININKLINADIKGCFLINHDFNLETFLPIIRSIRTDYPDFWIGVNFLAVTGLVAFPILASLENEGCRVDAYWGDDARIDERKFRQTEAEAIAKKREESGWAGLYFGGTAFKKQRPVDTKDYAKSAMLAANYMDVVTTSGIATGNAPEISKVDTFRSSLPDTPLALASGVTPKNALDYKRVDCFMVATGINIDDDFYNIDSEKLNLLILRCKEMEGSK